jgi:hypothetical protein
MGLRSKRNSCCLKCQSLNSSVHLTYHPHVADAFLLEMLL